MENTANKVLATGVAIVAGGVLATTTTQVDVHADQVNDESSVNVNTKGTDDLVIHLDGSSSSSSSSSGDVDDGTNFDPGFGKGDNKTDPSDPGDGGDTENPTDPGDGGDTETPTDPGDGGDTENPTNPGDGGNTENPTNPGDSGNTETPSNPGNNGVVTPVDPGVSNDGSKPSIPKEVITDSGVNNAVTKYNQALSASDGDASAQDVVKAKSDLDEAIEKALPDTSATGNSNSDKNNGVLGVIMTGGSALLTTAGLLIKKRFVK